jgi:hypothetical protein
MPEPLNYATPGPNCGPLILIGYPIAALLANPALIIMAWRWLMRPAPAK